MPVTSVAVPLLNRGPGILYRAPLGTALPVNTPNATGTAFTDAWPAAWVPLGATDGGTEAQYQLATADINAEEFLDALAVVATGRTVEVNFGLLSYTKSTLLAAYNAGTGAAVVSGTVPATVVTITPPKLGSEVNCMVGFEAEDSTYRAVYFNCRQTASVNRNFKNGADKTVVPFTYRGLADTATGNPFQEFLAGASGRNV